MSHERQRLIELLARLAFRTGDVVLASGRASGMYVDAKKVTYHPEGARLTGYAVLDRIRDFDVAAVGGPTLGADAIVAAAVWAAALEGAGLPGFIVRKELKGHGLQNWIEGAPPAPGSRVAMVEDVVTSGGSLLRAVRAAREAGLDVVVASPLVDREQGGREAVEAEGVAFRPVCTLAEIRAAAESAPPEA